MLGTQHWVQRTKHSLSSSHIKTSKDQTNMHHLKIYKYKMTKCNKTVKCNKSTMQLKRLHNLQFDIQINQKRRHKMYKTIHIHTRIAQSRKGKLSIQIFFITECFDKQLLGKISHLRINTAFVMFCYKPKMNLKHVYNHVCQAMQYINTNLAHS